MAKNFSDKKPTRKLPSKRSDKMDSPSAKTRKSADTERRSKGPKKPELLPKAKFDKKPGNIDRPDKKGSVTLEREKKSFGSKSGTRERPERKSVGKPGFAKKSFGKKSEEKSSFNKKSGSMPYDSERPKSLTSYSKSKSSESDFKKGKSSFEKPTRSYTKKFENANETSNTDFKKPFDADKPKRAYVKKSEKQETEKLDFSGNSDQSDKPKRAYTKRNTESGGSSYSDYKNSKDRGERPERNDDDNFEKSIKEKPDKVFVPKVKSEYKKRSFSKSKAKVAEERKLLNSTRDKLRNADGFRAEGDFKKRPFAGNRATTDAEQTPFKKTYVKKEYGARKEFDSDKPSNSAPRKVKSDGMRLNKFLSNAGIASRRKADQLIEAGEVMVNDQIITTLGFMVKPDDKVRFNGQLLKTERLVYVLLNKPKDYITTTDDPQERRTVMDLIKTTTRERIYPVGRLDRNTTGLLLLTNDGDLAMKLSHPKNNVGKIYQASLDKNLKKADFDALLEGIELEDGRVQPDTLSYVGESKKDIGIEIHSGKNRIVRRMFEHFGYEVVGLDRVFYAGLNKKDLPRGRCRLLTQQEVINLKHLHRSK